MPTLHPFLQAHVEMCIPKDHYRFILGKGGAKLKQLQDLTATKIDVPNIDSPSDVIKIFGTKDGIERARHEIQSISDEQVHAVRIVCVCYVDVMPGARACMVRNMNLDLNLNLDLDLDLDLDLELKSYWIWGACNLEGYFLMYPQIHKTMQQHNTCTQKLQTMSNSCIEES